MTAGLPASVKNKQLVKFTNATNTFNQFNATDNVMILTQGNNYMYSTMLFKHDWLCTDNQ